MKKNGAIKRHPILIVLIGAAIVIATFILTTGETQSKDGEAKKDVPKSAKKTGAKAEPSDVVTAQFGFSVK